MQHLFRERPELVPIARNPFTAALIQAYATETRGQLPDNQLQLYQSYIGTRLKAPGERLARAGLTEQQVIDACTDIAWTMFEDPELGLEAPLSRLEAKLPDHQVRTVVKLLSFARLIRLGGADQERVSFVHRRFNEYFVAQGLIRHPERIRLQSIPTDSQWRDALVLFCEVSDEPQATAIANFSWGELRGLADGNIDPADPAYLRGVHCLRFLRDAFRARPECLREFRGQLEQLLAEEVSLRNGPLSAKIALEATGLVGPESLEPIVAAALDTGDPWLCDTALRACRHLPMLSQDLEDKLKRYIDTLRFRTFFARRKELLFSLSLSDGFSYLQRYIWWKWMDSCSLPIAFFLLVVVAPSVVWFALQIALLLWLAGFYTALMPTLNVRAKRMARSARPSHSANTVSAFLQDSWFPLNCLRVPALCLAAVLSVAWIFGVLYPIDERHDLFSNVCGNIFSPPSCTIAFNFTFALIFLAIALLLVPWHVAMQWRKSITRSWQNLRKNWWKFAIAAAPLAGLIHSSDSRRVFLGLGIIGIGLYAILGLTLTMTRLLRDVSRAIQDLRRTRTFKQSPKTDRRRIESELSSLKTARARLRYVERLRAQRIKPTGTWSQGLPYLANDPASTRLAQLEERWLGLADR